MKYSEFEDIFSAKRLRKYVNSCGNDTRKAMQLYRLNLRLSQEIFTVISCFEVALRNAIDKQLTATWGEHWLRDFSQPNGVFYNNARVERSRGNIDKAYRELMRNGTYSHSKLLAEMEFGFWKYMFSNLQYRLSGRVLLRAFVNKPRSSRQNNYDNTYIFNELDFINNLRNRIAHHEPICFDTDGNIDLYYALSRYEKILRLFNWMGIDSTELLYGLDHVRTVVAKIEALNTAKC